ncbi:MAG: DUF4180 domain-containing protein [Bellilinea sp.]
MNGKTYLDWPADSVRIANKRDALDLVALCSEHETDNLPLDEECLDAAFFDLKSGLAGEVLLKLNNYRIRAAAIMPQVLIGNVRFAEFVLETNRGNQFRVYSWHDDAEKWLTG